MELRQLKYFLRVAETLNFSVAARELFITQSTLSQQILNLEHELDQQLFERNSHEVLLTESGLLLVSLAVRQQSRRHRQRPSPAGPEEERHTTGIGEILPCPPRYRYAGAQRL
jgi:DNA-binding transcriptional LysR family regulator